MNKLVALALVSASMLPLSPATAAAKPTCADFRPTIEGGPGRDHLVGTPGRDVIFGYGGADLIEGRGGADVICGGTGDDVINDGAGNDLVITVGGAGGYGFYDYYPSITRAAPPIPSAAHHGDRIIAGAGNDRYLGEFVIDYSRSPQAVKADLSRHRATGYGQDYLDDARVFFGSGHADRITGTGHDEVILGRGGQDHISSRGGDDDVEGGSAADVVDSGAGDDYVHGSTGDVIRLGPDNDIAIVQGGQVSGQEGRDMLVTWKDVTAFDGGPGSDVLNLFQWKGTVFVNLEWGIAPNGAISDVENVIGSVYDDTLVGNGGSNTLLGGTGNDQLYGGNGDDRLFGDAPYYLASEQDVAWGGGGTNYCDAGWEVGC